MRSGKDERFLARPPRLENSKNVYICSSDKSSAVTEAVSAVAYLKETDDRGHNEVGFIFGKAKLAPKSEITIPRLELCTAVLTVEIADLLQEVGHDR